MSLEALNYYRSVRFGDRYPTRKLLMILLADRADEEFSCFPSIGTLADELETDRRAVRRQIQRLAEDGYLSQRERSRENGSSASNRYFLHGPWDQWNGTGEPFDLIPSRKNGFRLTREGGFETPGVSEPRGGGFPNPGGEGFETPLPGVSEPGGEGSGNQPLNRQRDPHRTPHMSLSAAAPLPPVGGTPADAGRGGGEERDHGGVDDLGVPDSAGPVGDAPSTPGGWPPVADAGSGGGRSSRSNGSGGASSFADGFVSALYDELPGGLRLRLVRQVAKLERGGWAPWQVLALLADDGALVREREPGRLVLSVLRDSEGLRPPSEAVADRLWPDGWRQEPLQVLLEDVWDAFRASGSSAPLAGAQGAVCGFPDCDVELLDGDPPGGECASCSAMRQLGVTEMGELYARWLCSDRMAWAGRRLTGEPVFGPGGG